MSKTWIYLHMTVFSLILTYRHISYNRRAPPFPLQSGGFGGSRCAPARLRDAQCRPARVCAVWSAGQEASMGLPAASLPSSAWSSSSSRCSWWIDVTNTWNCLRRISSLASKSPCVLCRRRSRSGQRCSSTASEPTRKATAPTIMACFQLGPFLQRLWFGHHLLICPKALDVRCSPVATRVRP